MKENGTNIFVRFDVVGFHRWPAAPTHRLYLAKEHRHVFKIEISTIVFHDDREIEFHDLLELARTALPGSPAASGQSFGPMSCEHIARHIGKELARHYGRAMKVSVSEDGECGAVVDVEPV